MPHLHVVQDAIEPIPPAAEGPAGQLWAYPVSRKYQVEKGYSDYALRCAKITAINLGLRGRYGWVLCENSLSGETKFAYRIGSFYNEGPQGLRRGVIRDVPAEATPVPVLAGRVREQSRELLSEHTAPVDPGAAPDFKIVEVPQWLARLEPKLAALEKGESPSPTPTPQPEPEQSPSQPEDGPKSQQTLF